MKVRLTRLFALGRCSDHVSRAAVSFVAAATRLLCVLLNKHLPVGVIIFQ